MCNVVLLDCSRSINMSKCVVLILGDSGSAF